MAKTERATDKLNVALAEAESALSVLRTFVNDVRAKTDVREDMLGLIAKGEKAHSQIRDRLRMIRNAAESI